MNGSRAREGEQKRGDDIVNGHPSIASRLTDPCPDRLVYMRHRPSIFAVLLTACTQLANVPSQQTPDGDSQTTVELELKRVP
jgi:hypothetical protein